MQKKKYVLPKQATVGQLGLPGTIRAVMRLRTCRCRLTISLLGAERVRVVICEVHLKGLLLLRLG